jgi:flagellar hook protein FlgE
MYYIELLTFLIILSSCSNISKESDLSEENLKGDVVSTVDQYFEYDDQNNRLDERGYKLTSYNVNGNVESIKNLDTPSPMSWYRSEDHHYDESGNKTYIVRKQQEYYINLMDSVAMQYDNLGRIVVREEFDRDRKLIGKNVYEYESRNSLPTIERLFDSDNKLKYNKKKTYNKNGDQIIEEVYLNDRILTRNDIQYEYYPNGLMSKMFLGSTYLTYEYDANGNLIEEATNRLRSEIRSVNIYEYNYDKNGNWVNKISIKDEIVMYKVIRELKYRN